MKIDIVYDFGNSRITFDEELVHFNISVQNPERLLYNVTMPTIVANITLESTDPEIKSIKQGDKIEVYNELQQFLFYLMVVSVTFIVDTGRVEIEASGPPLIGDGLPHGMFKVTKDLVEGAYKNDVESMDEHLPRDKRSYLSNREDLMLSALWTDREELMYITPSYHRVANDKETKPWILFKEGSSLVPDYEVEFEDIIEVNITPARPPVSELRTREISNELDVVELKDAQNVRSYYIEGKNLTAVYVYSDGKSYLRWSDGIITDLGLGNSQIVGIFSDSYIEWTTTTSSFKVLVVKNRVTRSTLETFNISASTDFMWDFTGLKPEPLVTTSDRHGEVCWFEKSTFLGTVFGIRKDENGYSTLSTTTATSKDYEFVTAKEGHQALYAYFDVAIQRIYYIIIKVRTDGEIISQVAQMNINYMGWPAPYSARVVDAIYDIDSVGPDDGVFLLKSVNGPDVETIIVRPNKSGVSVWGEARFTETSLDVEPEDLKLVVLFYDPSGLAELGIYDIDGNMLTEESKLRAMHLFGTTSGSSVMVNYHNKAATYMLQDNERTVLLFNNHSVPWAAIAPGPLKLSQPIQKGDENIIDLPFIVEGIGDIDIPTEEDGRIELDIASYNVQDSAYKLNVQDMHLPPLMSTFHVELVEGEPTRKMKVVAINMNYDGVVSMRLSGILVPVFVPVIIPPPTIGSSISCVISGSEYKVSVEVTNNHSRAVGLRVSIGGNYQIKTTQPNATSTFERTYTFLNRPSGSIQVTAQAIGMSTSSRRLALLGRMSEADITSLGPNVDPVPPNVDINTYVCTLNRYYVDASSEQVVNGIITYNVYECLSYTVPEPLDDSIVIDKELNITCPAVPSLQTPTIAATASCVTSGNTNNASYQYRIVVINNDTKQVNLSVTIGGNLTVRSVNAGAASTFTRTSSTPWSSMTVSAFASLDGYPNSAVTTASRPVTCPTPDPAPTGLTWHKVGLSSQSYCFDQGYELEGTPCSTAGATTTAAFQGGPCYDYECKL